VFDSTKATSNAAFTLNRIVNGTTVTPIGAVTITPASNTSATLAGSGGTLNAGDVLQLVSPVQDATVGFTNGFVSYRNLDSVTALALNKWSFACGSFDGALLKTYINGVFDSTNGQAFVPQTGVPGALTIGCELSNPALTPADFFTGSLDDVRLYNRALTPAEIWRLYNNPARDRAPYQTRGRTKSAGGLSTITGTLAATEANDTIAAVGRVAVGGTLAVTEQADTIAAAGAVRVAGTLASTEQPDTLAATGTVTSPGAITGTLSAFQAVQTLIATGQIRVNGGLNVSQAAQTLAATGIVGIVVPPPSGQGVQVIVIS
jgi:hypothetical protein